MNIKKIFFVYICIFLPASIIAKNNNCHLCIQKPCHFKEDPADYRGPCCPRVAPPLTAYDFSQDFNEKKVWVEFRQGQWYICTQRLPFYRDPFNKTPNMVCTKAYPTTTPDDAPEGARCWRAGKRIVCQNEAGEITVHG